MRKNETANKTDMPILIIRLLMATIVAFFVGKLVSRLRLPSILGWLISGMALGPHALGLLDTGLLNNERYQVLIHVLECAVGLMIGTELVWSQLKKSGKTIFLTTLTQSMGTFLVVTLVFGITFRMTGIPLYLAFLFGGIALATAPAPALSIVQEFNTHGPVTKTLIPMAALDDIIGCAVFFTTTALIAGKLSAGDLPSYMILLIILLPLTLGVVTGWIAGQVLRRDNDRRTDLLHLIVTILLTSCVGFVFNNMILPRPILNFMLLGMAFSATFTNMISHEKLMRLRKDFTPYLVISMIVVILNLGAPLDYHLIMGAGAFTTIYIVARAVGKYWGAYFGANLTHSPRTVKKYLGLTLLPHSGVSLVFTGIAVSILNDAAPECSEILQGTIAAAAVINEIIAVIVAKKGFEWAGEL